MAASRRDRWQHDRTGGPAWARLLSTAFAQFADPASSPRLVSLASEAPLGGLLDDLESLCGATAVKVSRIAGAELGRSLDAEARPVIRSDGSPRLVIVDRIDLVGGPQRQRAAAVFLDELARDGVSACVTVGLTRPVGEFAPALESRLAAGFVIHVPQRPPEPPAEPRAVWSLARIIRTSASRHGLSAAALAGSGRSRQIVQARNLAMYLARRLTRSSFDSIGAAFGHRDHTTVMRGVRAVEARMTTDAAFAADVERLLTAGRRHA
jgi:hypothetical protein